MTNRHYGLDLFRFLGAFIVLAGHLTALLTFTPVTTPLGYFTSPLFWFGIISLPVPVFFMISGYFSLSRPVKENEIQKTSKSFFNVVKMYAFWMIIFVGANNIINGGSITANILSDIVFGFFNPVGYSIDLIGAIIPQGKFFVQTAPLWYLYTFAGIILVTPIFKSFMTQNNIKLIRWMMAILFVGTFVWPLINTYANAAFPNIEWIAKFFARASFFDINRIGYSFLFYYLLGGWINLESKNNDFVSKLPTWGLIIGLVVSLGIAMYYQLIESSYWAMNPTVNAGASVYGSGYESLMLLPGALILFLLFNKLDGRIKEDSRLGQFIKQHSNKTLGIYILHVLVIGVFHNLVGFANVNTFLTGLSGFTACLVYFGFAVAIYLVSFLLVSLLKKLPIIKMFI